MSRSLRFPWIVPYPVVWLLSAAAACGQSAVDGFAPNPDGIVRALAVQADGKLLVGGEFGMIGGTNRSCLARLNVDGTADGTFDPGANGAVRALAVQPNGKILVGGDFTTLGGGGSGSAARSHIGRLLASGAIDTTFNPGADWTVNSLALQSDGKILVAGAFLSLAGTNCNYVGRLSTNGTWDVSFQPPQADSIVNCVLAQPDGKIVLSGWFTKLWGKSSLYLGRLNADGTVDPGFVVPQLDNVVNALALQPDGRLLLGGPFSTLNSQPGTHIGRLLPNGAPDPAFNDCVPDGAVDAVFVQSDGKILLAGEFLNLGSQAHAHVARLNVDGTVDATFSPSATDNVYAAVPQPDGSIVLGGAFLLLDGQSRAYLGRLYPDGTLDATFDPAASATVTVYSIALQPDRKILLGGSFTNLGGVFRTNIARVNPDGTVDSFNPGANGTVRCLLVQPDGKIVAGGTFTSLGGLSRTNLGRLNADGSPDIGFNAAAGTSAQTVYSLGLQPDGKLLVAGSFLTLNSQPQAYLGRLNANGSLDTSFTPVLDGTVSTVLLQPDGAVLIGGGFHTLNTQTQVALARLTAAGLPDGTFTPVLLAASGSAAVQALALQPDGRVLLGGTFTRVNNQPVTNLARVSATGTLDATFSPGVNGPVNTLALQADGKIFVGGWFNILAMRLRYRLGLLNPDGSDSGYDTGTGANGIVNTVMLEVDGKALVGGAFTQYVTETRHGVLRSTPPGAALGSIEVASDGTTLTWKRSGAGPELQQVTLETSSDGTNYAFASAGIRFAGGWQFTSPVPESGGILFARVQGRAGDGAGSSGLLQFVRELYFQPPPVLTGALVLPDGGFQFLFNAAPGGSFTALATTNLGQALTNWTALAQATEISAGSYEFIDRQASEYPVRFYRVRMP